MKSSVWIARLERLLTILMVSLLAVLAALRLAQCIAALAETRQLDYYEGVVYDNAARILRTDMLYQPIDRAPYSVAAYMPSYLVLTAALRAALGDGFGPGRALSVVAGLMTAYLVGRITATRYGSRGPGAFAACLFLAISFPGEIPWMSLYRVDMLGVGFAMSSIAVLDNESASRRTVVAASLASLAILTKQLLFGAGLAGLLWLLQRDRKQAVLFGSIVLTIVGVTCAALELSTHAFLANTVYSNINPIRADVLLANLGIYWTFEVGPLIAATWYVLWRHPAKPHRDLVVLYWAATFVPLIGMAKVGAYHNYWIESAAITAVLAAVAVWSAPPRASRFTWRRANLGPPLVALAVGLFLAGPIVLGDELVGASQLMTASARNSAIASVIARVRSEPSDVIAEPYDVVVLADRPVQLETVIFSILFQAGRWDPQPMLDRICSGKIGLLVLSSPIEQAENFSFYGVYWWPRPIIASLRVVMRLERVEAGRYLYTPRPSASPADCPA